MYGSSFWTTTFRPRALKRRPREAVVMPLPSPEATPPVTKMNLVSFTTGSDCSRRHRRGGRFGSRSSAGEPSEPIEPTERRDRVDQAREGDGLREEVQDESDGARDPNRIVREDRKSVV